MIYPVFFKCDLNELHSQSYWYCFVNVKYFMYTLWGIFYKTHIIFRKKDAGIFQSVIKFVSGIRPIFPWRPTEMVNFLCETHTHPPPSPRMPKWKARQLWSASNQSKWKSNEQKFKVLKSVLHPFFALTIQCHCLKPPPGVRNWRRILQNRRGFQK